MQVARAGAVKGAQAGAAKGAQAGSAWRAWNTPGIMGRVKTIAEHGKKAGIRITPYPRMPTKNPHDTLVIGKRETHPINTLSQSHVAPKPTDHG